MTSPTALELLSLAQAQRRSGDIEAARITVERAVALEPRNLDALLARADDLAEIGDSRAAVSFYSAAIRQSAA